MGFRVTSFVQRGRNTRSYGGLTSDETAHDLDFIFEKEGKAYGVEVKNTLGYMPYRELRAKIRLCEQLGIRPVFAARMLPKVWVHEVHQAGGFALIVGYQFYPWGYKALARMVREELELPVCASSVIPRHPVSGQWSRQPPFGWCFPPLFSGG